MDGILNVLKPPGMTSFDVVAHLRGLLGTRKIGHAGTLDPLAAGVLPVCAGKATKAVEFLMDKDKRYRAELTLGVVTDTQDSSGKVIGTFEAECRDDEIVEAVGAFTGKYLQMPPMYSAIRVDGKRLYELAREGAEVERRSREVEIYSSRVLDIDRTFGVRVLIDVHCSKGTYIRTLCSDIGDWLGCGAHMSFLLRRSAGPFDISGSYTLEALADMKEKGTIEAAMAGVDSVFENLAAYNLDSESERKFRNGMEVVINAPSGSGSLARVYGVNGGFIALGSVKVTPVGIYLKVKKFF